jgi:hypothetical protein
MAQPTPDLPRSGTFPPEVAAEYMAQMAKAAAMLAEAVHDPILERLDPRHAPVDELRAQQEHLLEQVNKVGNFLNQALLHAIQQSVPIPPEFLDLTAETEADPETAQLMADFDRAWRQYSDLFRRINERIAEQAGTTPTPPPGPFTPDAISFINARPALAAMRAMWAGKTGWQQQEDGPPYFTDKTGVTVYAQEGAQFNPLALDAAWQRVLSLDDSKVSTFLICLGKWMADTGGEAKNLSKTRVHVADILSFRGLKKHHAGGFRREHKEEARADILALNSIWVRSIEEVRTARGKVEKRAIDSRLLEVAIESNPDLFGGFEPFAFRVAPGDWAGHFLGEHNRQVATLLRPVMRYDPDKQRLPMRLGIYLASLWRNRAHNASYDDAPRVATLLEGAFIALPTNNFERFRQQVEDALDRLQSDAVIGAWEYVGDGELPARKWLPVWLGWKIKIVPVGAAVERYTKIAPRRQKAIAQGKRASKAASARKKTA